jgi:hypothetical protein
MTPQEVTYLSNAKRAKVEVRGCLESPGQPSEPLSLGAGHAIRRLAGKATEHQGVPAVMEQKTTIRCHGTPGGEKVPGVPLSFQAARRGRSPWRCEA